MNPKPENDSLTEPGADNLRRALGQLPPHEPAPDTWARIAAQLAADAALPRLVAELPAHEPEHDLWASIAGRLDAAEAAPPRTLGPLAARRYAGWLAPRAARRALALAASLVLLVLAGAGWWQHRPAAPAALASMAPAGPRETLTVHEETMSAALPAALPAPPPDVLESQGLAFIKKGCSRQPAVCNSAEFQSLNTQLTELQTQQQVLRQASQRFGNSPELTREQARLVNLQAAVTRQLVNLLIS